MAEKKGVGHAYNVDFLNVVFAASSIFLFLSVIWMVWDDYDRDWKSTQRQFAELEYQVTQASLDQARARRRSEQADPAPGLARGSRRRTSRRTRPRSTNCAGRWRSWTPGWRASRRITSSPRRPTIRIATTSRPPAPTAPPMPSARARRSRRLQQRTSELQLTAREDHRGAKRAAAAARRHPRRVGQGSGSAHRDAAGAGPPAHPAARPRAERAQGLLPRCAAARFHGADA